MTVNQLPIVRLWELKEEPKETNRLTSRRLTNEMAHHQVLFFFFEQDIFLLSGSGSSASYRASLDDRTEVAQYKAAEEGKK